MEKGSFWSSGEGKTHQYRCVFLYDYHDFVVSSEQSKYQMSLGSYSGEALGDVFYVSLLQLSCIATFFFPGCLTHQTTTTSIEPNTFFLNYTLFPHKWTNYPYENVLTMLF